MDSTNNKRVVPAWLHAQVMLAGVAILALCFAQFEIQVEGPAGWAANLPTWRVDRHPLLDIFWGGRPLTGYHVWIFSFMALIFHLPLLIHGQPTLRLEARILGSLMVFWMMEDFFWFLLNPAYGFHKLTPESVAWHKHWILGWPVDYVAFGIVGAGLLWFSFRRRKESGNGVITADYADLRR